MMTSLTYVTLSPPLSGIVPPYFYPGSLIRDLFGDWFIKFSWGILVVLHVLESLYTATLVKRYRTPFGVGVSKFPSTDGSSFTLALRPCTFWEPSCSATQAGWS